MQTRESATEANVHDRSFEVLTKSTAHKICNLIFRENHRSLHYV